MRGHGSERAAPPERDDLSRLAAGMSSGLRSRAMLDHARDALVLVDEHGRIVDASAGASTVTGRPLDEQIGSDLLAAVHAEDREVAGRTFRLALTAPGSVVPLRFRLCRADGSVREVEVVLTNLLDDPAARGVLVDLRDLTAEALPAPAVHESEQRLRAILQNLSDTITLLDAEGRFVSTSGLVRDAMGYSGSFWATNDSWELVHPDDLPEVAQTYRELLAEPGGQAQLEFRARHADGGYLNVEAVATNLLEDPGVGGIVVSMRNITDRKRAESQLAEARDRAVRELEIRNEFIATVSHELRTPIHGMLGLSELLATSDEVGPGAADLARSINRVTRTLQVVLDDILDVAKIDSGRLRLVSEPVVLVDLVADVAGLFRAQVRSRGLELYVHVDESLPPSVLADAARLRQVLTNLVANAVKFTHEGSVSISVGPVPEPTGGATVRLAVADTGIGIADEAIERVFEPFSQAHASTAREYGGTGLGLTIDRRLVELMGGTIDVRSEPGQGSCFWVDLPLAVGSPPQAPASGDPHGGRLPEAVGRDTRVVIVEDNAVSRLLVQHQLARLGYEPLPCGSAEEGLELIERSGAPVALIDRQLPGIGGPELARQLRSVERRLGRTPMRLVALTADALPTERAACLDAGMDEVLVKPVGLEALAGTLSEGQTPGAPRPAGSGASWEPAPLEQLVVELGDRGVVVQVAETYVRELPGRVAELEAAGAAGDGDRLARAAHVLGAPSATVGAAKLASWCAQLEVAAAGDADQEVVVATTAAVGAEARRVRAALELWLVQ